MLGAPAEAFLVYDAEIDAFVLAALPYVVNRLNCPSSRRPSQLPLWVRTSRGLKANRIRSTQHR